MPFENGDVFPCLKIDQVFEFQFVFVDNPRLITVLPVGSQQAILSLQRLHPGVSFLASCTTQNVHGFLVTDDFSADFDAGVLHPVTQVTGEDHALLRHHNPPQRGCGMRGQLKCRDHRDEDTVTVNTVPQIDIPRIPGKNVTVSFGESGVCL